MTFEQRHQMLAMIVYAEWMRAVGRHDEADQVYRDIIRERRRHAEEHDAER